MDAAINQALSFNRADVSLMAVKEKAQRDTTTWNISYGSTADQLRQYKVTTTPPKDEWVKIDVGEDIEFFQTTQRDNEDEDNKGGKGSSSSPSRISLTSCGWMRRPRAPVGPAVLANNQRLEAGCLPRTRAARW